MIRNMRLAQRAPVALPSSRRLCVVTRATAEPATGTKAKVSFTLPHHVEFGQEVALVGELETLGNWDATAAIPLSWSDGDVWTTTAEVPVGASIEYKYIIRSPDNGEVLEWQPCDNLVLELPPAAGTDGPVIIKDAWEGSEHTLLMGAEAAAAAAAAAAEAAAKAEAAALAATTSEAADDLAGNGTGAVSEVVAAAVDAVATEEDEAAPAVEAPEVVAAVAEAAAAAEAAGDDDDYIMQEEVKPVPPKPKGGLSFFA